MSHTSASYAQCLQAAAHAAAVELQRRGIPEKYLQFGGPGEASSKKPRVPTDAFSEFLANRAMGDWAEQALAEGIRTACGELQVVPYGDADRLAAGEPGFKEFYLGRWEEVRQFGKRPDLLLFPRSVDAPSDLSTHSFLDADRWAAQARAAIEVRSSKFEVLRYMAVRGAEKAPKTRETLSFTVKVEDLQIVYRWLERHPIPQFYCQMFFDAAFALGVLDIFQIIGSEPKGYAIEKDANNQMKTTIKVPVTRGRQIGIVEPPDFRAEQKITRLGRHDTYVVPTGGRARLDRRALLEVLDLPLPPPPPAPPGP